MALFVAHSMALFVAHSMALFVEHGMALFVARIYSMAYTFGSTTCSVRSLLKMIYLSASKTQSQCSNGIICST